MSFMHAMCVVVDRAAAPDCIIVARVRARARASAAAAEKPPRQRRSFNSLCLPPKSFNHKPTLRSISFRSREPLLFFCKICQLRRRCCCTWQRSRSALFATRPSALSRLQPTPHPPLSTRKQLILIAELRGEQNIDPVAIFRGRKVSRALRCCARAFLTSLRLHPFAPCRP